jgi:predicted permease
MELKLQLRRFASDSTDHQRARGWLLLWQAAEETCLSREKAEGKRQNSTLSSSSCQGWTLLRSHVPAGDSMLYQIFQDLRYAARVLRKSPTFATVAVLTLALGVGANTAIFTVVNALLLKPLPYRSADRLVTVWQDMRARGGPADEWATPGNYADWRGEKALFEEVAVVTGWRPTLTGQGEPEPIPGEQVSHEYFSVLGVVPALGRAFRVEDDVPNAPRVVMISDGIWRRHFGGAPDVIGRTVALSGQPHEIIGVLPAGFRPIVSSGAGLWRPLRLNTATPSRGAVVLRAVARLPAGLTIDRAQAAATVLAARLEAQHPDFNEKVGISLIGLRERIVGDIRTGLLVLLGAVAFVLLIACANIANLVMARASGRGRELAVRGGRWTGSSRSHRRVRRGFPRCGSIRPSSCSPSCSASSPACSSD